MAKRYEMHLISNTHWDREWLNDFQETRMMLVEFFDRLLDILDSEPDYKAYLLDSQTVPVEDYLEVRPEKRECIIEHVTNGRLQIGPWYTCPEGFLVNGESLARNLLYGHKVAQEFGGVMKVGHTPFSYGQNSQMPQIYAGFGIDTILFYHGVSHEEVENEFWFEGADGTRALGSQMSSYARYNAYYSLYRSLVFGTTIDEREYTWTKGGLPFHLCGEGHISEQHHLLDPPKTYHGERLGEFLKEAREAEIEPSTTKYLAFMMGHDSSLADRVEIRIVKEGQELLKGEKLIHMSLPDHMDKVKSAVGDLTVLKGERRVPKIMSGRLHLYSDVLSSRTRMKCLNARAEQALQRKAEPFAAVAWILGSEYPETLLDLAWKTMLKCHAHDSIAGSGVDDIERDVTDRLRQVINISRGIERRGLQNIQLRIDNSDAAAEDVLLTVYNPSAYPRTEIVTATVDVPSEGGIREFSLKESGRKKPLPVQYASRKPSHAVVNHADDAPMMMTSETIRFHFEAREVPALGYTTYQIEREDLFSRGGLVTGENSMENEHLIVGIETDGTLTVFHKDTGALYEKLHSFEDGGEAGHAWMHIEPDTDQVVTSRGCPVTIALEENGPLLARFRIDYRMIIPAGLDENGGDPWQRLDGSGSSSKRTEETRGLNITSHVTLRKGGRSVEIKTRFENTAHNHRLRVRFPTHLDTKTCGAEGAFDVVERPVEYDPDSPWFGNENATFPMHRFLDLSDGEAGLAVINDGLREYEVTQDAEHAIAVTLLRAYEVSLATVSKRWDVHPEMELSQCPGKQEFRYWICPHAGSWDEGEVYREAERLSVAMEPAQVGAHSGDLPKKQSFLSVEPANLILSALKRSEDGEGLILRLFNPTDKAISGEVKTFSRIRSAHSVTLEEEPIRKLTPKKKSLSLKVGKKKIVTLKLVL